jgi:hypothetical protein
VVADEVGTIADMRLMDLGYMNASSKAKAPLRELATALERVDTHQVTMRGGR